jgi:hypothetical protein
MLNRSICIAALTIRYGRKTWRPGLKTQDTPAVRSRRGRDAVPIGVSAVNVRRFTARGAESVLEASVPRLEVISFLEFIRESTGK